MNSRKHKRALRWLGAVVLGGAFLMSLGGCPIDNNTVVTETIRAALQSASNSIADAISAYLANR